MAEKEITREYIIQVMKELDSKSEKTVGRSALYKLGINQFQIDKYIPEGTTELKKQLGLKVSRQESPHDPNDLLQKLNELVTENKKLPVWKQIEKSCGATQKVWLGHSGNKGKKGVFEWYRDWLIQNEPDSDNIELVNVHLTREPVSKFANKGYQDKKGVLTLGQKDPERIQYGKVLNFGNMLFEPVNEQGVVFLFGMMSRYLGFTVKHIQTAFPDCEAFQHLRGGATQEVKIEFEFKSREYNHPIEGCDYIVCWKDNWGKDCPLPVIELRKEIKRIVKLGLPENLKPIK